MLIIYHPNINSKILSLPLYSNNNIVLLVWSVSIMNSITHSLQVHAPCQSPLQCIEDTQDKHGMYNTELLWCDYFSISSVFTWMVIRFRTSCIKKTKTVYWWPTRCWTSLSGSDKVGGWKWKEKRAQNLLQDRAQVETNCHSAGLWTRRDWINWREPQ